MTAGSKPGMIKTGLINKKPVKRSSPVPVDSCDIKKAKMNDTKKTPPTPPNGIKQKYMQTEGNNKPQVQMKPPKQPIEKKPVFELE